MADFAEDPRVEQVDVCFEDGFFLLDSHMSLMKNRTCRYPHFCLLLLTCAAESCVSFIIEP